MHALNKPVPPDLAALIDPLQLKQAIADNARALPALKQAVSSINDGLKACYQAGASAEDIVLGRAHLLDILLSTLAFDGTLAAGAAVSRSQTVTVPQFVAGDFWIVVRTRRTPPAFGH